MSDRQPITVWVSTNSGRYSGFFRRPPNICNSLAGYLQIVLDSDQYKFLRIEHWEDGSDLYIPKDIITVVQLQKPTELQPK